MINSRIGKLVVTTGILSLLTAFTMVAKAEISVSFSLIPQLREVAIAPSGYVECTQVAPGFYEDVWHSPHRVCYYGNSPNAGIWIAGHWGCAYFEDPSVCIEWKWYPAHWVRKGYWEYGIRWQRNHPWFWWREQHHHWRPIDRHHHHHHHPFKPVIMPMPHDGHRYDGGEYRYHGGFDHFHRPDGFRPYDHKPFDGHRGEFQKRGEYNDAGKPFIGQGFGDREKFKKDDGNERHENPFGFNRGGDREGGFGKHHR